MGWEEESGSAGAECLEAALGYLSLGWSPLALCPPDHIGVGSDHGKDCNSPGKRPWHAWKDYQDTVPTEDVVRSWWARNKFSNVGLALGPVSGVIGIDLEGPEAEDTLRNLSSGDLPRTLEFTTGKGRRLLYRVPAGTQLQTTVRPLEIGEVRFQWKGAQTVMPPSRHPSGLRYRWIEGRSIHDIEAAEIPAWLVTLMRVDQPRANGVRLVEGEIIPVGQRHSQLLHLAGVMRAHGMQPNEIFAALDEVNTRCEQPQTETELRVLSESMRKYPINPELVNPAKIIIGKIHNTAEDEEKELPPETDACDVAGLLDLKAAGATVEWVWPGWIQSRVLTLIAAEGGCGKTRFCADLTRRIAFGLPWPDGTPMTLPKGAIVLWVVSDNHHDEMVSLGSSFGITNSVKVNAHRLDPYGGTSLDDPRELEALERRIMLTKATIVFIDTVGNSTDRNLSKQEDAKAYYEPLQKIARRQKCAILCLTHLNAAGQVLGRRATEKVRLVIRMDKPDPDGQPNRRALKVLKSNNKHPDPLGVTMGDGANEYDKTPPTKPGDEPGAGAGRPDTKLQECADWLAYYMRLEDKMLGTVINAAEGAGFSKPLLYRAMSLLGIDSETRNGKKWIPQQSQIEGELSKQT